MPVRISGAKVRAFEELAAATRRRTARECLMKGFRPDGPPIEKAAIAVMHRYFGHERLRKGTTIVIAGDKYLDKIPELLAAAEAVRRCKGKLILDGAMAKGLEGRLAEYRREVERGRGMPVRETPGKAKERRPDGPREGETRAEYAERQKADRERRERVKELQKKYFGQERGLSR